MVEATATPIATELPRKLYEDLLDRPHGELSCWAIADTISRRRGITLDVQAALSGLELVERADLEPGDLVLCAWRLAEVDHVGIYVGGPEDRFIHSVRGGRVHLSRLALAEAAGRVAGFARPGTARLPAPVGHGAALAPVADGDAGAADGPPDATSGEVLVLLVPDPLRAPERRHVTRYLNVDGLTAADLFPGSWEDARDRTVLCVPGRTLLAGEWEEYEVAAGDRLAFLRMPAGEPLTTSLLVSLAITAVSFVAQLLLAPALEPPERERDRDSPTFDLEGIQNTVGPGNPIPVIYGTHLVGGQFGSFYSTVDAEGRTVLYAEVILGHGKVHAIGGITEDVDGLAGDDIPDTLKIEGTPAKDYEGTEVSIRLGSTDQTIIPGFESQVTQVPYSLLLDDGEPFLHDTLTEVDGFEVLIHFPRGLYNISPNGSINGRTVTMAVRWRVKGTTAWTEQQVQLFGHTQAAFSRSFRKDGLSKDVYEIEVERISPPHPETDADKASETRLFGINQIVYDGFSHPGMAKVGWKIVASEQLSGSIPLLTHLVDGREVWVWDGVDPQNPSFQNGIETFSKSPAWVLMDMLTHPVYGGGRNAGLSIDNIDLSSFGTLATESAQLLPDGRSGTAPRAEVNMVWDDSRDLWSAAVALARSMFCDLMWVGTKVVAVPWMDRTPIFTIPASACRRFHFEPTPEDQEFNFVSAEYINSETDWRSDFSPPARADAVLQGAEIIERKIGTVGITSIVQAARLARHYLNRSQLSKFTGECITGRDYIHLLPGDVGEISHFAMQGAIAGRVVSANASDITLDRDVTVEAGENWRIKARSTQTGTDVWQERTPTPGTYPAGSKIPITPDWNEGDLPQGGDSADPWTMGPLAEYLDRVQLVDKEIDPGTLECTFRFRQDATGIYDDDPENLPTFTPEFPDPRSIPVVVEDLHAQEIVQRNADGGVVDSVRISWRRPFLAVAADVWYRLLEDGSDADAAAPWVLAARTAGEEWTLHEVAQGDVVEISVVAVSKEGARRRPETGSRTIVVVRGPCGAPADPPAGVRMLQCGDVLELVLPEHTEPDVDVYEVRIGHTWAGSWPLGRFHPGTYHLPWGWLNNLTVLVRARSRSGFVSRGGPELKLVVSIPAGHRAVYDADEANTSWNGTKNGVLVAGSGHLELDVGSGLSGDYTTQEITLASAPDTFCLRIGLVAGIREDPLNSDEALFPSNAPEAQVPASSLVLTGREVAFACRLESGLAEADSTGIYATLQMTRGALPDVVGTLEPTLEVRLSTDGGQSFGSWVEYCGPLTILADTIQVRLSLQSPHERYVSEVENLRISVTEPSTDGVHLNDAEGDYPAGDLVDDAFTVLGRAKRELIRHWPIGSVYLPNWANNNQNYQFWQGGMTVVAKSDGVYLFGEIEVRNPHFHKDIDGTDSIRVVIVWSAGTAPDPGDTWTLAVALREVDPTDDPPQVPGALETAFFNIEFPPDYPVGGDILTELLIPNTTFDPTIDGIHSTRMQLARVAPDSYGGEIYGTLAWIEGEERDP